MGTRSLTKFYESFNSKKDVPFAVMYRQFDGYPDGHGRELAEFLVKRKLVNGIGGRDSSRNAANGMGCLAAQVVSEFKGGEIGGIYLTDDGDHGQDYVYEVHPNKSSYTVVVRDRRKVLFEGSPDAMLDWVAGGEQDTEDEEE